MAQRLVKVLSVCVMQLACNEFSNEASDFRAPLARSLTCRPKQGKLTDTPEKRREDGENRARVLK